MTCITFEDVNSLFEGINFLSQHVVLLTEFSKGQLKVFNRRVEIIMKGLYLFKETLA